MSAKFWKPGTEKPGAHLNDERKGDSEFRFVSYNKHRHLSIQQQRQHLPIFKRRNEILYMIDRYKVVVIVGETGSGKSTQIPQYLLEAGWAADSKSILVTQPRRVAAVSLASRVADERGTILGQEIGYIIRFEDCSDDRTKVKFMTDGMLIRTLMRDPLLEGYSVIVMDEAHERSVQTDLALGLLKKIIAKRPDLKVIISSATLDAEAMKNFYNTNLTDDDRLDTAAILTVEGRMWPVDIFFSTNPVPDYLEATVQTVCKIHVGQPDGDILVFLTGMEEVQHVVRELIEKARAMLKKSDIKLKMKIVPLYAGLPGADQFKVFERTPKGMRKVVIATNIAETSVTIDRICYIIDCGFVKLRAYSCRTDALVVIPISQASAKQRCGRAGRVRSGCAYRLYTQDSYEEMNENNVPEIQRCSLPSVILQLKALGVSNIVRFPLVSPPPAQNLLTGAELLYALGAIDKSCQLTELGMKMAELPVPPMFSAMLLKAPEFNCSQEILTIVAMAQVRNVFVVPPKQKREAEKHRRVFAVAEGDLISLLNVYRSFCENEQSSSWCQKNWLHYKCLKRAIEIRDQLERCLKKLKINTRSSTDDVEAVTRCLVTGLFSNAAKLYPTGEYRTIRDNEVLHIHPTSIIYPVRPPPAYVIFGELIMTSQNYMRDVTAIEGKWLHELAEHYYDFGTERELSIKRNRLDEESLTDVLQF
ncbi:unnamed protein product [Dimorphilus gyrociliatus]|uniref:RNA helicase n=1 Tax=Dimorphilus gyrociliatus TaxID=2664684 RepID=A0A7I8VY48_9ANNE|nr:unnamed protein product [Dimorphilus gyrociliatus]